MTYRNNPWAVISRHNPAAPIRLICLPYAGGGASVYNRWLDFLPASIELCAVQLPGREERFMEEPFSAMQPLVTELVSILGDRLVRPYILFGHSMGAVIAYEMAHAIRQKGLPSPVMLIVSGRIAPQEKSDKLAIASLSDQDFLSKIREFQGTPEELWEHPDLMYLLLPMLRADFTLIEQYRYHPYPPLDYPVITFTGQDDRFAPLEQVEAWKDQTVGQFQLYQVPGDHFFVNYPEVFVPLLLQAIYQQTRGHPILKVSCQSSLHI